MIIESILNLLKNVLFTILDILPDIPEFPASLESSINIVMNTIFSSCDLLDCFIRPATIRIMIPVLLIIWNFDLIYSITVWILKKIPFVGIE